MRTVDTCLDTHQSLKMGIKKSSRPSYKMTMIIMNQKQLSIAKRRIPIILCQNQRRELSSILYFRVQGFKQESKQLWSWSWQTTVDCLNQYQLLTFEKETIICMWSLEGKKSFQILISMILSRKTIWLILWTAKMKISKVLRRFLTEIFS